MCIVSSYQLSPLINNRPNGKELFIGFNDNSLQEAKKLKEGSIITVKHLGTNVYGTLQFPKFYRERTDVTWEDVAK